MKRIIFVLIIIFNCCCYSQTVIDNGWKNVFLLSDTGKKDSVMSEIISSQFHKLEAEKNTNDLDKTKLKFGLELIRVKDGNKEIVLRKSEYPLPDIRDALVHLGVIDYANFDIYAGLFQMPISINVEKNFVDSLKIWQKESFYAYGLLVIPLKKERDVYLLRLSLLTYLKIFGMNVIVLFRDQETTIKPGEKIRIDIDPKKIGKHVDVNSDSTNKTFNTALRGMHGMANNFFNDDNSWRVNPKIKGKEIIFSSNDEFFKYISDHLILSLEDEK